MLHADGQSHAITLGRIDQYCGHFLDKELADGTLTKERAQGVDRRLRSQAWRLLLRDARCTHPSGTLATKSKYNYVCGGQHFTVGGLTSDGRGRTNTLTLMFLQVYARLYLSDPSISVRIHKNTPYEVWEHAIEASKIAGGMPIFENDDIIVPCLVERGLSHGRCQRLLYHRLRRAGRHGLRMARKRHNGCESFCNLMGILNMAIHNGTNPLTGCAAGLKTGYLYDYKTF